MMCLVKIIILLALIFMIGPNLSLQQHGYWCRLKGKKFIPTPECEKYCKSYKKHIAICEMEYCLCDPPPESDELFDL